MANIGLSYSKIEFWIESMFFFFFLLFTLQIGEILLQEPV